MTWKYEKFLGCPAIYAFCPRCGYFHAVGMDRKGDGIFQLRRCPECGKYLYNHHKAALVIWEERTLEDLVRYAISRHDDPV